jgi:hypothetical protein
MTGASGDWTRDLLLTKQLPCHLAIAPLMSAVKDSLCIDPVSIPDYTSLQCTPVKFFKLLFWEFRPMIHPNMTFGWGIATSVRPRSHRKVNQLIYLGDSPYHLQCFVRHLCIQPFIMEGPPAAQWQLWIHQLFHLLPHVIYFWVYP